MVIAALSVTAHTWKPPKHPSVGEWGQLWCIWTMEQNFYSKEMNHQAMIRHGENFNAYY